MRAFRTLLIILSCAYAESAQAQGRFPFVFTSLFTDDQGLKSAVGALFPIVQPRGIRITSWSAALAQSIFHRDVTETAGVNFGLIPSTGVTFLPGPTHLRGVGIIDVNDSYTHTILNGSDADELVAHQFGNPGVGGGFNLNGSSSTALHEITHSLIFRTKCFRGSVDKVET